MIPTHSLWGDAILSSETPPWQPFVRGQSFSVKPYSWTRKRLLSEKDALETSTAGNKTGILEYHFKLKQWSKSTPLGSEFPIMIGMETVNMIWSGLSKQDDLFCFRVTTGADGSVSIVPYVVLPLLPNAFQLVFEIIELDWKYSWSLIPTASRSVLELPKNVYPTISAIPSVASLQCTAVLNIVNFN